MSDAPPPVSPGPTAGGDGPLTPDRVDALLADFRAWLLAEASGGVEPRRSEPADLTAVVREFTALRHEVHLQTKATRAAVERLGEPPDPKEVQRPLVQALVDVADALRNAQERVRDVLKRIDAIPTPQTAPFRRRGRLGRWLFGTPPMTEEEFQRHVVKFVNRTNERIAGLGDGYELSLKRVGRALATVGVETTQAVGERFDPTTMEAVELADGGDQPSGTVLAESRRGYRWHGEVFRFARVTVAR
jgi:molecular chaperone GrpE